MKEIKLYVNDDEKIDERIYSFSSNEIVKIINSGVEFIIDGRNFIMNLSLDEITEKTKLTLEKEMNHKIINYESQLKSKDDSIEFQKGLLIYYKEEFVKEKYNELQKIEERNTNIIHNYQQQLEDLKDRLKSHDRDQENIMLKTVHSECEKERTKYEEFVKEKYNEIQKIEERNSNLIHNYQEQLEDLKDRLKSQDRDQENLILKAVHNECEKERKKYDAILKEKDNQNLLFRESFEKSMDVLRISSSLTNVAKGIKGELTFGKLAEEFKDFPKFELEDIHNVGGMGDFHLHFEKFNILVDAKNYTTNKDQLKGKVQAVEVEKIKSNLRENSCLSFAWMISMNTRILKKDKCMITFEWINSSQCVCYVNELLLHENPEQLLRLLWNVCDQIYNQMNKEKTDESFKDKFIKMNEGVDSLKQLVKRLKSDLKKNTEMCEKIETSLSSILNEEMDKISETNDIFVKWWNNCIKKGKGKIQSKDLWKKFKGILQEDQLKEYTPDKFRQLIRSYISSSLIENLGGTNFEIKEFEWK